MSKSITRNYLYNLMFQFVTLFIPLITVPYISRVLGKEGIGTYSYTLSITQYFIIIGTLGISLYGNRQIAYVRDDKKKMSKTFWSILYLNITTTTIALLFYMIIFWRDEKYGVIFLIQSINILAAMLDVSWLFMGLEDFKKTVTRNIMTKILGVACIFIFVRTYNDLYRYITISSLMVLLGNLSLWVYIPKTVSKVKIKRNDIKAHIVPAAQLFVPQIAIQIYAVLDKSMLGNLANTGEVGLYDQSQKIVQVVLSLVTALGVVMLPRMSNTFANGDNQKMKNYLNHSLSLVSYVSIPLSFGLASISKEFVPWFFGADFKSASFLIVILTPIISLIAISNVLGIQYLLPTYRTREFTASVTVGAIINVIFNYFLIPKYNAVGTCVATVIAELFVTLIQCLLVRKEINWREFFVNMMRYIIAASIMFIVVRVIGNYLGAKILTTMIQSTIGVIVYVLILIILREKINSLLLLKIHSCIKRQIIL